MGSQIHKLRGDDDAALDLIDRACDVLQDADDEWAMANAWAYRADILQARGELDEALRIRREEQLPVYERLGDVHSLIVGRVNLAINLAQRNHPNEDGPEIVTLLSTSLRDARRLAFTEATQIAAIVRQLGYDPDAPPFTT